MPIYPRLAQTVWDCRYCSVIGGAREQPKDYEIQLYASSHVWWGKNWR